MPPDFQQRSRARSGGLPPEPTLRLRLATAISAAGILLILIAGFLAIEGGLSRDPEVEAAEPVGGNASETTAGTSSSTTSSTTTAPSSTTTTTTLPSPPTSAPTPSDSPYVVPPTDSEPEAKQLAADIAYTLTTYEASDDHRARLSAYSSSSGVDLYTQAGALLYPGSWSQGQVVYAQLGGLRNGRASVMVVTRQTVGSGGEVDFSLVRTLDIRLVLRDNGWEFDFLASAGGSFESLEDLTLAHAVARDPRIEMPDSARLDILSGLVSPVLLSLMADIADQTPYALTVLVTGHPENVFETDRKSDHTVGRAIDIVRVGDRQVVDDRGTNSATLDLVDWLYYHPAVRQIGSPWDLDDELSTRSFTDAVHQDHIHIAVNVLP